LGALPEKCTTWSTIQQKLRIVILVEVSDGGQDPARLEKCPARAEALCCAVVRKIPCAADLRRRLWPVVGCLCPVPAVLDCGRLWSGQQRADLGAQKRASCAFGGLLPPRCAAVGVVAGGPTAHEHAQKRLQRAPRSRGGSRLLQRREPPKNARTHALRRSDCRGRPCVDVGVRVCEPAPPLLMLGADATHSAAAPCGAVC